MKGQLIDQRGLACTRRAGDAYDDGTSCPRKHLLHQRGRIGSAVLNRRYRTGDRARITVEKLFGIDHRESGRSMPRSSQIFLTRDSLTSRWRGTDVIFPEFRFL